MIKRQTKKNRRYTKRSEERSGLLPIGKRNKTNNKRHDHERDKIEFENLKKNILKKKID